jgi:hypothetical protein
MPCLKTAGILSVLSITIVLATIIVTALTNINNEQLTISQCDAYRDQCERAFYGSPQIGQCTRLWIECRQTGTWNN